MSLAFNRFDYNERLCEQRELFGDAFPEQGDTFAVSVGHYRWKFHGLRLSAQTSYEYAAVDDDGLVGYYAALPYPYVIGSRHMLAGMVCDVMTHSRSRGKGVFTDLGRFALEDMHGSELDFVTGYPIRPEVMGGHLRCGWQIAFKLPMYIMPLEANAILSARGLSWLAPTANVMLGGYMQVLRLLARSKKYTYRSCEPEEFIDTAAFERFLRQWSASVTNHLVKSTKFYQWRLSAPGTRYRLFVAYRGDTVVAAAIGRWAVLNGIPSVALLDVMALRDRCDSLPGLYRHIEREARDSAEAIVTMMSKHSARKYRLARSGFIRSPFTFRLILRSVSDTLSVEQISDEKDWHLMWIDSDDL